MNQFLQKQANCQCSQKKIILADRIVSYPACETIVGQEARELLSQSCYMVIIPLVSENSSRY